MVGRRTGARVLARPVAAARATTLSRLTRVLLLLPLLVLCVSPLPPHTQTNTTPGDRQLVITLMIALAIHQGLEGLALGSVLALTTFPTAKKVAMLLLYSITTPIGVAIGIAVASTYDPRSITSRAVQGTISGVSAGMLLYIGMYQLVAEEFSRDDLLVRPRLRFGMYGALLLGAACMCLIGIWA
jgi:zinc transporter ZupT